MKIGIDARMYGPAVGGGGLGRYVEQLVTHLQQIDTDNRYILFLKPENTNQCIITNPQFEKRVVDIHWYGLKEQLQFPRIIDQEGCDLIHFPHWNIPLRLRTPFVTTIHDLILLQEPFSARASTKSIIHYALKYKLFRTVLYSAIKRAQRLITISDYSKTMIQEHFPFVTDERIDVIYNGVTPLPGSVAPPSKHPSLLYVGNAYPHKNLDMLLEAFDTLSKSHPTLTLTFAGRWDQFYERLESSARTREHSNRITFIKNPTDIQLADLYRQATLYIAPARVEGFGLPGLEAMLANTPVIAAGNSCLPEIYADAALYFDPHDPNTLINTIEQTLKDHSLQQTLIQRGTQRVSQFSWHTMAKMTHAVYYAAQTTTQQSIH